MWDIEDNTQLLSEEKVDLLRETARTSGPDHAFRAGWICVTLGQRIGDTLTLAQQNIYVFRDRISIVVTEGKTVPACGAYCLSLPKSSLAGLFILEAKTQAEKVGVDRLFPGEIEHLERKISLLLIADLRSLRRTGLTRLAMGGASLEELLSFSRHTSTRSLEIYLGRGLFHQHAAMKQVALVEATESKRFCW
jgi:integrase